ncbi:hypothetical protein HK100_000998 [Physocladia obscura]|uniref:Uncharacterized protein n=1 Tax=Physocladia obscura TaxID=109957 RepID=A0AAD5XBD7_9FUNG|nr:hypothetical protein HK100_000998 [Physocladia obscura]
MLKRTIRRPVGIVVATIIVIVATAQEAAAVVSQKYEYPSSRRDDTTSELNATLTNEQLQEINSNALNDLMQAIYVICGLVLLLLVSGVVKQTKQKDAETQRHAPTATVYADKHPANLTADVLFALGGRPEYDGIGVLKNVVPNKAWLGREEGGFLHGGVGYDEHEGEQSGGGARKGKEWREMRERAKGKKPVSASPYFLT